MQEFFLLRITAGKSCGALREGNDVGQAFQEQKGK